LPANETPVPVIGNIVLVVNPKQQIKELQVAPAIVTFVDDLVINAHVFLNTAPAVVGVGIPHKSIKGHIIGQPYWEYRPVVDAFILGKHKGG